MSRRQVIRNSRGVVALAVCALWLSWWLFEPSEGRGARSDQARSAGDGPHSEGDPGRPPSGAAGPSGAASSKDGDDRDGNGGEADERDPATDNGETASDVIRARVVEARSTTSAKVVHQAPGGVDQAPRMLRFSRNGQHLSFLAEGRTHVVSLEGGSEEVSEAGFLGLDWLGPTEMVGLKDGRLHRWSLGQAATPLVEALDEPGVVLWPRVDPKGDAVVYVSKTSVNSGDIHWIRASDGVVHRHVVTSGREWAPSAYAQRLAFEGPAGVMLGRLDGSATDTIGPLKAQFPTVWEGGTWFVEPQAVGGVLWWVPEVGSRVVTPSIQAPLGPVSVGDFGAVALPLVGGTSAWWVQSSGRIVEVDLSIDGEGKASELAAWGTDVLKRLAFVAIGPQGSQVVWASVGS